MRPLAALLAWAICVAMTCVARGQGQDPAPKAERFSHQQHVDRAWFDPDNAEVWRDCRGCHRFDAQQDVSAPQRECDACHVGGGRLQDASLAGWQRDLGGYRTRTRDAFRHHTHYVLECRECHLPAVTRSLTDFDVVTGPAQCARCHERREAAAATAMVGALRWFRPAQDDKIAADLGVKRFEPPAAADRAKYANDLVAVFAGPTGGVNTAPLPLGGDFDHDDHVGIKCVDCHATIPAAAAKDVGTGQIPAAACGSCHQDGAGKVLPVASAPKQQMRMLRTLGTFTHADHYRFQQAGRRQDVCSAEAYAELERSTVGGCDVCHKPDKAAIGLVQPDFPFAKGNSIHQYPDCKRCHDVAGWQTGETAAKPLHASTGGAGDGWAPCGKCHVLGTGKMAVQRPMVNVERFAESTFRFATHTHPDITTKGIATAGRDALGDCAKCHRTVVPELPSRLTERTFRHATHLPKDATAYDCAVCHDSAKQAANAGALANDYRTYSVKVCATCHRGGEVTEVVAAGGAPASRAVVQFPHAPHVQVAACTSCHAVATDGRDVTTRQEALQCNLCHDHRRGGEGKPADPSAEGLFDGGAASCVRCHHEPAAPGAQLVDAVPPVGAGKKADDDPRDRVETPVFAGFAQPQFHPLDRACKECHVADLRPDPTWPGLRRVRTDHVFVVRTGKVHDVNAPTKEPANCLGCHWTSRRDMEGAVPAAAGDLRRFRVAPTSPDTRREFGNKRGGYPGKTGDG